MPGNLERMKRALAALLERGEYGDWVIFEEVATGKFVQFAGSGQEGVLLDLPEQELKEKDEMARARNLFASRGHKKAWKGHTFNVDFGRDTDAAARMAMEILAEVFLLPAEFQIEIKEN